MNKSKWAHMLERLRPDLQRNEVPGLPSVTCTPSMNKAIKEGTSKSLLTVILSRFTMGSLYRLEIDNNLAVSRCVMLITKAVVVALLKLLNEHDHLRSFKNHMPVI